MLLATGTPLDEATFIWVVVGTVFVVFVAALTLRRAWVSFEIWPLQRHPLGRARGWIQAVSEPISLETARDGNPHFTRKLPLHLSTGQSAILIQVTANTQVAIHEVNLRCAGEGGTKPDVILLSDQDPRGATLQWTANDAGETDLFHTSLKAASRGRSIHYRAFITSTEPSSGTLRLRFDMGHRVTAWNSSSQWS